MTKTNPTVLVVDFGAQYAQLIARRVREAGVYREIVSHDLTAEEVADFHPAGIILSGGPKSVRIDGAPQIDPAIYELDIPILGICYGAQLIAQQLGGTVNQFEAGEYGRTSLQVAGGDLLSDQPNEQDVWMSHFDCITQTPAGFTITASTKNAPVAAFENQRIFGVQYHPEVSHTAYGQQTIEKWLDLAGIKKTWTMTNVIEEQVAAIRSQVGKERAICGLSGGVDSSVAAYLLTKQNYEVIGLFMKNWHDESTTVSNECPWLEDSNDAMLVAEKIGIPFQTVDLSIEYKDRIIDYMFNEYESGRTPNPDVLCNREIKFDVFLRLALSLGADYVATGHYCQKDFVNTGMGTHHYVMMIVFNAMISYLYLPLI